MATSQERSVYVTMNEMDAAISAAKVRREQRVRLAVDDLVSKVEIPLHETEAESQEGALACGCGILRCEC
tara:strand:+ start:2443 stop:2652 length:210 start_codon:yes stop_codon:yes gene_type:complete